MQKNARKRIIFAAARGVSDTFTGAKQWILSFLNSEVSGRWDGAVTAAPLQFGKDLPQSLLMLTARNFMLQVPCQTEVPMFTCVKFGQAASTGLTDAL